MSHEDCTICRTVPASSGACWIGGEQQGEVIGELSRFEVVGAPVKVSSNVTLYRCPECGTCYEGVQSYEYLATGSEDSFALTRLGPDEGRTSVAQVEAQVTAKRERFRKEADALVAAMREHPARKHHRAAYFLYYDGAQAGFDIRFAAPVLLEAYLALRNTKPTGYGRDLDSCLSAIADRDPEWAEVFFRRLDPLAPAFPAVEMNWLYFRIARRRAAAMIRDTTDPDRMAEGARFFIDNSARVASWVKGGLAHYTDLFVDALLQHSHVLGADCPGALLTALVQKSVEAEPEQRPAVLARLRDCEVPPPEVAVLLAEDML